MAKTMISLHPRSLAVGLTAGVVYTICITIIALWPTQAMSFFVSWFHGIDLTKIAVPIQLTFSKFIVGLLGVMLSFYIIGLIYGLLYNLCYAHCKKRGWI